MEILILGAIIYLALSWPRIAARGIKVFFLILFLGVVGYLLLWVAFILLMSMVS